MYFDFEDYHPDISPVGTAISRREGVLIAFIVHLLAVIFLLLSPKLFPEDLKAKAARVQDALRVRAAACRAAGAETAAGCRAVRSRPAGANARARAEAEQSAAVFARQFARAGG